LSNYFLLERLYVPTENLLKKPIVHWCVSRRKNEGKKSQGRQTKKTNVRNYNSVSQPRTSLENQQYDTGLVTWDTSVGRGGASRDRTGRNCRQWPIVWGASRGRWSSSEVSWVADVAWPTGWLTASGDGLGNIRTSGRTGVRRVGTGDWPRRIRRGSSSGVGGVADIDWAVGSLTAGRRRNVARRHGGSTCS
jgi:hypothetical protein